MVSLRRLWTPAGLTGRQLRHARLKVVGTLAIVLGLALLALVGLAGCGEKRAPADNAVEATEQNTVRLAGVDYRVVRFRELNTNIPPDRAIFRGPPPEDGNGYYAAFLQACNRRAGTVMPTSRIHLEDAFGQRFAPLASARANVFAYRPRPLKPGECLAVEDSAASRSLDGAALVFELPLETAQERPLILELARPPGASGRPAARIQLDL